MSGTVNQFNYTIFNRSIDGTEYTVDLVGGEPVYKVGGSSISVQSVNAFLELAVQALAGSVTRNGTINENALEHFGNNANPGIQGSTDTDTVSIGGAGVGGSFRAEFSDDASTEAFEAFAADLLGSDPSLTKLYDVSLGTNGGANRFQILRNDEIVDLNEDLPGSSNRVADSFIFKWSGQGTPGTQTTDDFDTFVTEAAKLFGGTQLGSGTMTGFFNQTQTSLTGDDLDIVRISGSGVGGTERWEFDDQQDAQNFKDFFDNIIDTL